MDERTLVERQNRIWNRMQEIMQAARDESRDLTAEERQNWDAAEGELTEVSRDLERVQRMGQLQSVDRTQHIDTGGGGPEVPGEERYAGAFDTYLRRGASALSQEQRELLERGYTEVRAGATDPGSAGGYTIPEDFRATITETLQAFGGLLGEVNVITTSTGARLPWPTNDDTGNKGAILDENTQISEQDLTLGQKELGAYTYTSRLVRLSLQLLQDSAFSLEGFLARKLGERIGRALSEHVAVGTGTDQPQGLVTGGTVGRTGAASAEAAIVYNDLIELEHSVDPAYRNGGRARYALSDDALRLIRKLKDSDDRPLWVPVPAPGFPSTINGWPYTIDQDIPSPAVDATSIVFGDFQAGYIGRRVLDMQLMVLRERYADFLQVGYFGFTRFDGEVDDTAAYRVFQHGAAS